LTVAERLRAIVEPLPNGAAVTLPAELLRSWLADDQPEQPAPVPDPVAETWRTKLWTVPESTRLGVREVAEALDRSADWVYRAVSVEQAAEKGRNPLPCKRLDGVLVFEVGAVRRWLQASEVVVNPDSRPRLARVG